MPDPRQRLIESHGRCTCPADLCMGDLDPGEAYRCEPCAHLDPELACLHDQTATDTAVQVAVERLAAKDAETTRYHQQQHAEAVREIERPKADLAKQRDELQDRIDKALGLHAEYPIYGECGHEHTEATEDGVVDVDDIGLTCEDGRLTSICRACCTDSSEYQTQECADHHAGPCWPCPTRVLLAGDTPEATDGDA